MAMKPDKLLAVAFISLLGLTACSREPFVMPKSQDAQLKKQVRGEKEELSICYNSNSTSFQEIMKMATEECARTRAKAVFKGQDYWQCALLTPTRATFSCVGKDDAIKSQ